MSVVGDRHLVLMGLMASGKSAVGAVLARRLGRSLLDSDVEIERSMGCTVRELAERIGPDAMHDAEATQLLDALAQPTSAVITPAASTIERADCRAALRAHGADLVWLRVPVAVLAARFTSGPHRPDFGRPVAELLDEQMARRGPLFVAAARLVIDADDRVGPEELADQVLAGLPDPDGGPTRHHPGKDT